MKVRYKQRSSSRELKLISTIEMFFRGRRNKVRDRRSNFRERETGKLVKTVGYCSNLKFPILQVRMWIEIKEKGKCIQCVIFGKNIFEDSRR